MPKFKNHASVPNRKIIVLVNKKITKQSKIQQFSFHYNGKPIKAFCLFLI